MRIHRTGLRPPVSERDFLSLMAQFPSGVVVVTTLGDNGVPLGLTCSSLCSVSLRPPLLLVCIANGSRTLNALRDRGHFAVNLLHHNGRGAARTFAGDAMDRFEAVAWQRLPIAQMPGLSDAAHTAAECRLHAATVTGDHTVVVGEVLSVQSMATGAPLLYGLRQYVTWPGESTGQNA